MKRSYPMGERLDARDMSDAVLAATMFAASAGMILDLATGHAAAFDCMLASLSDDDDEAHSSGRNAQNPFPKSHMKIWTDRDAE